jgi:hypothetical protein
MANESKLENKIEEEILSSKAGSALIGLPLIMGGLIVSGAIGFSKGYAKANGTEVNTRQMLIGPAMGAFGGLLAWRIGPIESAVICASFEAITFGVGYMYGKAQNLTY